MNARKKKITLEDLAVNLSGLTKTVDKLAREMRGGFAESKNTIINAIDELAVMTKRGFDAVDGRFDKLEKEMKDFRADNVKDHERMDLRLGEAAWRFEISNLKKRVVVLEDKAGLARKNF